jgi:hypothetical protein
MMASVVAGNTNKTMLAPMVGSGGVCIWQKSESGSRFCVYAFGRNVASVDMKMFSNLIYFIKEFYKCCTFNAVFKDNAAIICITVQHKDKVHSHQL